MLFLTYRTSSDTIENTSKHRLVFLEFLLVTYDSLIVTHDSLIVTQKLLLVIHHFHQAQRRAIS